MSHPSAACLAMALFSVSCCGGAEWLVVCAGQSNMDGRAPITELPAAMKAGPRNVIVYRWGPHSAGKPQVRTPLYDEGAKQFGPEAGMVHALAAARPQDTFIIAKFAAGGTALWQWVPDYQAPPDYRKATETAANGHLYEVLRTGVLAVRKIHPQAAPLAFCWLQGESDAAPPSRISAYLPNLRRLVANSRKDFNTPTLRFIAAEPASGPAEISDACRVLAKDDAAAVFIPCRDLPHKDRDHYNAPSQLDIGRRFAEEMLR